VSIEALLALQLQLCTLGNETAADAAFNSRLSRVVTKLFAKVIKAESASARPFSPEAIDIEALLCSLGDMLVATTYAPGAPNRNRQDAFDTCTNMGRSLMIPMLSARGRNGVNEIREIMDGLGIDPQESTLAALVTSCEPELELEFSDDSEPQEALPVTSSPSKPPSMNAASLVSALGSAPDGPERDAAVASLRRYNALHGEDELHAHLSEVSAHFRAYLSEQLKEPPPRPEITREDGESNAQSISLSERIRHLRSKLHATEAAVQSVIEPAYVERQTHTDEANGVSAPATPSRRSAASETRPTPSRIPRLSASSPRTTTGGAASLRERLAAAQKSRAKAAASEPEDSGRSSSAYGHAAALRARLEAVKQQSKRGAS
jgi:hypothetical protein